MKSNQQKLLKSQLKVKTENQNTFLKNYLTKVFLVKSYLGHKLLLIKTFITFFGGIIFAIFEVIIESVFERYSDLTPNLKSTPKLKERLKKFQKNILEQKGNLKEETFKDRDVLKQDQDAHDNKNDKGNDVSNNCKFNNSYSNFTVSGINQYKTLDLIKEDYAPFILKIKDLLPFDAENYQKLVTPFIDNFIAYVHALPASECFHHYSEYGLLRHSFETAIFAINLAMNFLGNVSVTPKERRNNLENFLLIVFVGAMLHDCAKVLSDLRVSSLDEKLLWNPLDHSLIHFLETHKISEYSFRYQDNRGKLHESLIQVILDKFLTYDLKTELLKNKQSFGELLTALNTSKRNELFKIIKEADVLSVKADLSNNTLFKSNYNRKDNALVIMIKLLQHKFHNRELAINEIKAAFYNISDQYFLSLNTYEYLELVRVIRSANLALSFNDKMGFYEALINNGIAVYADSLTKLILKKILIVKDGYIYQKSGLEISAPEYLVSDLIPPTPLIKLDEEYYEIYKIITNQEIVSQDEFLSQSRCYLAYCVMLFNEFENKHLELKNLDYLAKELNQSTTSIDENLLETHDFIEKNFNLLKFFTAKFKPNTIEYNNFFKYVISILFSNNENTSVAYTNDYVTNFISQYINFTTSINNQLTEIATVIESNNPTSKVTSQTKKSTNLKDTITEVKEGINSGSSDYLLEVSLYDCLAVLTYKHKCLDLFKAIYQKEFMVVATTKNEHLETTLPPTSDDESQKIIKEVNGNYIDTDISIYRDATHNTNTNTNTNTKDTIDENNIKTNKGSNNIQNIDANNLTSNISNSSSNFLEELFEPDIIVNDEVAIPKKTSLKTRKKLLSLEKQSKEFFSFDQSKENLDDFLAVELDLNDGDYNKEIVSSKVPSTINITTDILTNQVSLPSSNSSSKETIVAPKSLDMIPLKAKVKTKTKTKSKAKEKEKLKSNITSEDNNEVTNILIANETRKLNDNIKINKEAIPQKDSIIKKYSYLAIPNSENSLTNSELEWQINPLRTPTIKPPRPRDARGRFIKCT